MPELLICETPGSKDAVHSVLIGISTSPYLDYAFFFAVYIIADDVSKYIPRLCQIWIGQISIEYKKSSISLIIQSFHNYLFYV